MGPGAPVDRLAAGHARWVGVEVEPDDVVVVGSANLDVVLSVLAIPKPGETVLAVGRAHGPGGKGANQAVAAARSGASTRLVAAVGDDVGAALLRVAFDEAGVRPGVRTSGLPTGTAYVVVDGAGENAIVVDAGANAALVDLTPEELAHVGAARVVLCQLEVPVETVITALAVARGLRVLNAAPALDLPSALTAVLDVLVVNEQEALSVSGRSDVSGAVEALLARVPEVVVTLGAAGVLLARRGESVTQVHGVPAREVVDTTGAGDVFCGAFCAARAAGEDPASAARLACAAASLSVERPGAAASAPTLDAARARLRGAG